MAKDLTSPEAFEQLVREHQAMVFRTLARLTGRGAHDGTHQVEDLAQEVFLRLYRALADFRGDAALSTYLYRIVLNVAQDEWKRRRKERARIAHEPTENDGEPWLENFSGDTLQGEHARTPEQQMITAQVERAVDDALQELPEHERAVLVLYHQDDCSYEGIAAILRVPVNTVRTHLHRGRKRMAELVRKRLGRGAAASDTAQVSASQQRGATANVPPLNSRNAEVR